MLTFDDTRIAFHDKSDYELKKALWMFRTVGNPALVNAGSSVLNVAMTLHLPVSWALKPTVFSHFCGGETIDECDDTINTLGRSNIKTILDYSAEGKQTEEDFDYTANQILATIRKANGNPLIPHAVFKTSGLARKDLLEKKQAGHYLTEQEQQEFQRVKQRIDTICAAGFHAGVPVMIDAEESWIQDVVDKMVEDMILKYNTQKPLIYHTLQMYRHDRLEYLEDFINKAREAGRYPAFKLVRGAYMEKERDLAEEQNRPSPIYPNKKATDKAYDTATRMCLDKYQEVGLCIGTHNELSSAMAADIMEKRAIPKDHDNIWFSQLLGMSDHISYKLAHLGFNVCKYVPYGPVKTVVPYLIRRAQENTSVAGQTSRELQLLETEVERRKSAGR